MDRNHHTHSIRSSNSSISRAVDTTSSDFVLQWGNRKRLRCMKVQQVKEHGTTTNSEVPGQRIVTRIERRVSRDPNSNQLSNNGGGNNTNGHANLRQRPASPAHRILRNSETSSMRGHSNGGDKKGVVVTANNNNNNNNINNNISQHHYNKSNKANNSNNNHGHDNHHHHGGAGGSGSPDTANEGKKIVSSPAGESIAAVWPPKFVIALTNKEKEEDFMAIKGSKLPQRPKKRAKFVQRTLNLVSPGSWLCDLTLERYEVREKKVSKKRPRGLKAMGNMDSDSE